jgi:hypothetical protein
VLLDNSINCRQSKPGSFAHFFRRKEWFKNAAQCYFVHAATGVGNAQANKFSGTRGGIAIAQNFRVVEFHYAGANNQPSAFRHRITRIDRKIHQNLLDHSGVTVYGRQIRSVMNFQRDMLA